MKLRDAAQAMVGATALLWDTNMTHIRIPRLALPFLALSALLAAGCLFRIPLTRPTEDVTPSTPEPEGNTEDTDRSLSNTPPTAHAGPDATYDAGAQISLDGTGSSDPDGDSLTYQWQQVAGSPTVDFQTSANASIVTFTAPTDLAHAVTLTFRLRVSDGFASDTDDVRITIRP